MFDAAAAMAPGAPRLHDKGPEARIRAPERNLVAEIHGQAGDPDAGFATAAARHDGVYQTNRMQHAHLEPHTTLSWIDEAGRLNVRTSSQTPFLTRDALARIFALDPGTVRVFATRMGGGFGGKQEMLTEDVCVLATLKTGRPAQLEFTRAEEFAAATSRHSMRIAVSAGANADGTLGGARALGAQQHRRLRQSRLAGPLPRL